MTSAELCEHAGITYRQLVHWEQQGYIKSEPRKPGWRDRPAGSGTSKDWSDSAAQCARTMSRLIAAGFIVEAAHQIAATPRAVHLLGPGVVLTVAANPPVSVSRPPLQAVPS